MTNGRYYPPLDVSMRLFAEAKRRLGPYRHKDCGGELVADMDWQKPLHPPLYHHRCVKCGFDAWLNLPHEAPLRPACAEPLMRG